MDMVYTLVHEVKKFKKVNEVNEEDFVVGFKQVKDVMELDVVYVIIDLNINMYVFLCIYFNPLFVY